MLNAQALACSGKPCQVAEAARQARLKTESRAPRSPYAVLAAKGWGHGAIVAELRRRETGRRRRPQRGRVA